MNWMKWVAAALGALIISFGVGWAFGGAGRGAAETALGEVRARLDIAEARGQILEARVSLYNVNFAAASRHFEEAKAPLRRVHQRYQNERKNAAAGSIAAALEQIAEGQRLAGKLDQAANSKANDALEAIRVATSQ
jgi:hypothetical protein